MRFIFGFFLLLIICSCQTDNKLESEISKVEVDLMIERFDRLYAESNSADLPKLKQEYPFLFSKEISDSIWLARLEDTLQQQLLKEVDLKFRDFSKEEEEIHSLFQHLKYYNPLFKTPRVITVTNDVDYRNKVIVTDTIVLIALDTYLGSDHEFYGGIQQYLKQNFEPNQIVVDLTSTYVQKQMTAAGRNTLLEDMIDFGKQLYFKDLMIPFKSDAEKIGYTEEQVQWSINNESNIWSYFVERELLYATDPSLKTRFINEAPFTKFGLELDSESPGRLGQFIGWQIVRSYMDNHEINFSELMLKNADEIFKESKFKPRK